MFKNFAACSTFLGIEGWHKYLPKTGNCEIDFERYGFGSVWLVLLGIIDILIRVGIIVAVVFFIIGAFKMVVSQGSPDGVNSARSTMTNAIIGLILLVISTWVISFVVNGVFKVS